MNKPDETPPAGAGDRSLRFLFEQADIRGETVHLDDAYRDILAIHQYAPGVSRLLGEFLAASVLLSTTLKFEGKLILQARSEGEIPLLMVESNSALEIRAIARGAEQATSERFDRLLANGQLAITIDPEQGQRYQGIVPLVEDSLANSLDAYFRHSEQLGTRLWLAADGQRAAGLLLQQLPAELVPGITYATGSGNMPVHWRTPYRRRSCWGWIPATCCTAFTMRSLYACLTRHQWRSAAAARGSAPAMPWPPCSRRKCLICSKNWAVSPWIASSATSSTALPGRIWLRCWGRRNPRSCTRGTYRRNSPKLCSIYFASCRDSDIITPPKSQTKGVRHPHR